MALLNLPDQTIPENQKTKEWHMLHATDYATYSITDRYNEQRSEMLKLYRGYNGELSKEEEALITAITCPHGFDLGVEYIVYPLIQTKIEQIVGEYLSRPLRRKAYVVDKKSKNKKYQKKIDMFAEQMARELAEQLQGDIGFTPETENPEMQIPENIEEHDFKEVAEEVADGLLNIFLDVRKEKHKFKELLTDYCITDRAHAVLEKKEGFTSARKVHPLDADYDLDPQKVVQDDHDYWFENYYLTENQIYNTFDLTKAQKEQVKTMFETYNNTDVTTYESQNLEHSRKYNGWFQTSNKVHRMRMIYAMWKSRKRVSIKVSEGKEGSESKKYFKKLDQDYKARKNDKQTYTTD